MKIMCSESYHFNKQKYTGCPQKKKNVKKVNLAVAENNNNESEESSNDEKVSKVFSVSMNNQKILCVKGKIENCEMLMALDSGATASILSLNAANKFGLQIRNSDHSIRTASDEVIKVCGETDFLSVEIANRTCKLKFLVIPREEHDVLLGLDWFSLTNAGVFPGMGIIRFPGENVYVKTNEFQEWDSERVEPILLAQNEDVDSLVDKEMGWNFPDTSIVPKTSLSTPEKKKFDNLLAEYKDVFASSIFDLGACTLLDFRIELLDKTPIYTPPYRASEETRKFLQKEMNVLLKAGIIRQSNSEYSAPVIVIDKKDGSKRIGVDYRKLNTITVTAKWPVSLPNDIFEDISSSKIFSTMDLKSGYYQIKMASYSIKYTAFSTPDGHYEFIVLPFGLKNAPAVFCRMMHMLLANLPPIKWFMDDIVIHSTNVESHLT